MVVNLLTVVNPIVVVVVGILCNVSKVPRVPAPHWHSSTCVHGQLPQYLAEDCQLLTDIGRRSLRSADVLTCATMRTRTRLGDRSFSVAGPCLWNSLPVALHDRDISLVQFKRLLKTLWFVYRAAAHSDCCFLVPCTNILTYLLT